MYIPEPFVGLFLMAFLLLMLLTRAFKKGQDEARETARKHRDALYERPKQIVVYSDDVIHDKIWNYINAHHFGSVDELADDIYNKDYLK